MHIKRLLAGVGSAVLLSIIFSVPTPAAPAPPAPWQGEPQQADSNCYKFNSAEKGFLARINNERADRDLAKLTLDPEASKVGKVHTREMIKVGDLYHSTGDDFEKRLTNWWTIGENVGRGSNDVDQLHEAFMNSKDHRKNILAPKMRFAGIGAIVDDDTLWVTVIFEKRRNPGTTLKMPDCN
ncbi:MAG: CAP domain-containing protein [Actinomycetota bacterium]